MKFFKLVFGVIVVLCIFIPAFGQQVDSIESDAAWIISGSAEFILKSNMLYDKGSYLDGSEDKNNEPVNETIIDDVIVVVKATKDTSISPYLKYNYDKDDENRIWFGSEFKKGSFSGEVNYKLSVEDENRSTTVYFDYNKDGILQSDNGDTIYWDKKYLKGEVDEAYVTYTLNKFTFTWSKKGVYGTENSFKIAFKSTDELTISLLIADSEIEKYEFEDEDYTINSYDLESLTTPYDDGGYGYELKTNPLVQIIADFNYDIIKFNMEMAACRIYIEDVMQNTDKNDIYYEDLAGLGFYFFYLNPTFTFVPNKDISIKVYGKYGLNLDTFADDEGLNDDNKPNEFAILATDRRSFVNSISYEAGGTITLFNIIIDGYYSSIENAWYRQGVVKSMIEDSAPGKTRPTGIDNKYEVSLAYDISFDGMSITPKLCYIDNMYGYLGYEEADEIELSIKAKCLF